MNRIREIRQKIGMSQKEFAITMGVSQPTVVDWEKNRTQPLAEKQTKIASIFGVSLDYLMCRGESEETNIIPTPFMPLPKTTRIPLIGTIACGLPLLAEENLEGYLNAPEYVHADFALKCKGDSMIGARIYDGDIVYIHKQPYVSDGEIAAIRIGDEATLKRVYHLADGRIELRAENPTYRSIILNGNEDDVAIEGKAVYFVGEVR